ncbi:DUF5682 family protein [Streptomyces sp. BB1-1-1]|uniref:DUF5682 family protein n=1 Tax=Streptomyces sp. BB1-1-1 TaxID=3074430 RepID=UPI0028779CC7|nr:DUF5682 family protein [Streptomyces sp. BB1-1-1]WND33828.1 DUF5682 family protein [Streptomyces sp. BB1-1-1]
MVRVPGGRPRRDRHAVVSTPQESTPFAALRGQLQEAAATFAGGPDALEGILLGLVDDVDRAVREPLEIFPVCHHSPASATAMARRLREKQPKVVYLELCEDMAPLLTELRNCRLPVAVQAFAGDVDGFPAEWAPLSVVAPITEASAEYQAIAYALDTPGVELVLVDRSSDHVFQWDSRGEQAGEAAAEGAVPAAETGTEPGLHGEAVGVEIGDLRPRFAELEEHLLRHGKVRHWSEWWHQYVEVPLGDSAGDHAADHDTYRQVMFLIGSLFRRLAPGDGARVRVDEDRERYMWTRMREHLSATGTDPADCLYVCGAFHAASRVAEFGLGGTDTFTISPRSATAWQYGLIPSSHAAIEAQFGLAAGSVSIASTEWAKSLKRTRVQPYRLAGQAGAKSSARKASAKKAPAKQPPRKSATASPPESDDAADRLSGFLRRPPVLDGLDEAELLSWSVDIVRAARRNGYLASTADAIAVFETSILLAGMRDRAKPTPYDFQDAAVTCIEKDAVPGRRDVRRLVEIMMGGDRIGQVGYEALPPLARDVHDRLEPLGLKLQQRGVQRALLDMVSRPELQACSDVLWMLRRLLPHGAARPIMGERRLGERSIQESWDLAIGTHQRALIELGYEGVSIEQVLEQRLRRDAYGPQATTATVLAAVEDATLYLRSRRLADELGTHALKVLATERSVDGAPEVLRRVRALLAYYRTSEPVLPSWVEAFVKTGYAHYCTLLPTAFQDEEATVGQVAAMLGFLFSMESLALSLGCDRAQLDLAVAQSHPDDPSKTALLWAARVQLGTLSRAELRARCDALLDNPLVVPAYPRYLSGFVHALEPVPGLADVVVEAVSNAFGRLPDAVLLPWLPLLITTLRSGAGELAPLLIREAGRIFPGRLVELDAWVPPWRAAPALPAARRTEAEEPGRRGAALLTAHPGACDAVAELLGCAGEWARPEDTAGPGPSGARLLAAHPATCDAVAGLIGCDGEWATKATPTTIGAVLTARHPDAAAAWESLLARA